MVRYLTLEREFVLKWRVGIRTAGLIAGTARRFPAHIEYACGEFKANARDVMQLHLITLMAVGEDFLTRHDIFTHTAVGRGSSSSSRGPRRWRTMRWPSSRTSSPAAR
ncbi:MAG: hypothetical protein WC969_08285 [Elusimicrobiota bacterium]|jgi:hypothetical protein